MLSVATARMHAKCGKRRLPYLSLLLTGLLAACGGGGGAVNSTPAPISPSSPPPIVTNYNTAEYRLSDGPSTHGAITAYNAGASGNGITVGIIDTGIAINNSEFSGRISGASAAFNGANSYADQDGHGTAVATVLAAARNDTETLGMAWGATVMALRTETIGSCPTTRTTNASCSFGTGAIAQALDHARLNGANVVNISLGGGSAPQPLLDAVSRATSAGIIIIVSAGNDGLAAPDAFAGTMADPAIGHGLVIIAGSSNADGTHSSFSNGALGYESVTLTALGNRVRAQDHTGALFLFSGTSFSAPQIAGAIALMEQAFPSMTPAQIVNRLMTTAIDAGATGDDSVFGRGILDLGRAFAPAGTTSLAGSAIPVSTTSNGTLSNAMGDVSAASATRAVAIDALGRAYTVALQPTLGMSAPQLILIPQFSGQRRAVAVGSGPFSLSFTMAEAPNGLRNDERFGAHPDKALTLPLSGSVTTRLTPAFTVAVGLGEGASGLAAALGDENASAAFLSAGRPADSTGFSHDASVSMLLRQNVGHELSFIIGGESGQIARTDIAGRYDRTRPDRYSNIMIGSRWHRGALHIGIDGSYMREEATLLGANLAPLFGVSGSSTLFADARTSLNLAGGWQLAGAYRRGWTSAQRTRLATSAWSFDLAKAGIVGPRDHMAVRISQPLRVTSGGVDLSLPGAYDYRTGTSNWTMEHVALNPRGREVDSELYYAAPLGGGWLSLNGYYRRQAGNIIWYPDDLGGAIRYTIGY